MKKFILLIILSSLMTGGFLYYYKVEDKEPTIDSTLIESNDLEVKEEDNNEPITEDIKDDNNVIEDEPNVIHNTNKNDIQSNNISNSNVVENKTNNIKQEEPKQEVVQEQPHVEPKVQTEWEKLGISEYDYYHSPMWSWARVDYRIEDYGTFEQTHQACIDAGNSLEDIISFSCSNINSYSGAYLGDMLKVKY